MSCEIQQKLQRELKIAADDWGIWTNPKNAHLSSGVSKAQLLRLARAAEQKKKSISVELYAHRQSCPACKNK